MKEQEWANMYKAAMDSVNLLNRGASEDDSPEEWADCVRRNVEHLKIVVGKEGWPEEFDLTPMTDVIAANDTDA